MKHNGWLWLLVVVAVTGPGITPQSRAEQPTPTQDFFGAELPNNFPFPNDNGFAATFSTRGSVKFDTPFHQELGSNGRDCGTCHLPSSGWSITPADVKWLFMVTQGTHPLFRSPDANRQDAPTGTVMERKRAYSMLIEKGLFRRMLKVPEVREFEVVKIDDPHGASTVTPEATTLALFRRPLTTANLPLINGVAWENRNQAASTDPDPAVVSANTIAGLRKQATGAVTGAEQAPTPPDAAVVAEVVEYENSLFTAQISGRVVGALDACGARGGPEYLSLQARVDAPFDLFDAWADLTPGRCTNARADRMRAQIARGQKLFNEKTVPGTQATCRGCHNVANNGTNFSGRMFDVGVSAAARRTPDLPLYTLQNKSTGELRETTDPGRAMISGLWSDIDRFKTPTLRGLVARAPYFHNGSAATLLDVVHSYEQALGFDFDQKEEADLVTFLRAL